MSEDKPMIRRHPADMDDAAWIKHCDALIARGANSSRILDVVGGDVGQRLKSALAELAAARPLLDAARAYKAARARWTDNDVDDDPMAAADTAMASAALRAAALALPEEGDGR